MEKMAQLAIGMCNLVQQFAVSCPGLIPLACVLP